MGRLTVFLVRKYQNESGLEMSDDVLRRLGKHVSKKIIAVDETATKTCFSDSKNVNIVKKRLSFNVGLNYVGIEYSFEKNTHLMLELFQIMIELRPVMKLIVSITFNPSGEYIVPVMGVSKSHTNEEIEETFKDVKMVEMMEYEHSIPYRFAIWIDNDVSS